jgi:hypothetical protein
MNEETLVDQKLGQREVGNMEAWMLLAFQPDAMALGKNRGEAQPTI